VRVYSSDILVIKIILVIVLVTVTKISLVYSSANKQINFESYCCLLFVPREEHFSVIYVILGRK